MDIVGVDTGGTFTDFIYKKNGKLGVYKQLSTPSDPSSSVLSGLEHVLDADLFKVVHGSTVATNAILERKGASVALVTNSGFEDVFAIGRQNRTELYNLCYKKPEIIVPSDLRFGVRCRVRANGETEIKFDEFSALEVVKKIEHSSVESVAVCFLFSYLNSDDEIKMGKLLEKLNIPVSLSHSILSEFREYERTSTTVVNAYISPKMKRYINRIAENIRGNELRIMQSNGGSISAEMAMDEPVRTILSGPAGGVVGAFETGKKAGRDRLISFDMGGTSTDVALIDTKLALTFESSISDMPVKVPMIDIHTVGAGGGSVAYIDEGDSLRVGPLSAGADPGPVCYGIGEKITVTDANLYLGRLVPDYFLGGNMELDFKRVDLFFEKMAQESGLEKVELAEGIIAVANSVMEKAIRVISVERGYDPSEFTLFSFGGAGGLHAASLSGLLNIPQVFIPENPGILSAFGMLMAVIVKDYSLTVMLKQDTADIVILEKLFKPLEKKGIKELEKEGFFGENISIKRYLDMRYRGQSFEIMVPFVADYEESFHALHKKHYGYSNKNREIEIVTLRLRSSGVPEKPEFKAKKYMGEKPEKKAFAGKRGVIFDKNIHEADLIKREYLKNGNIIKGPAIILEYTSTVVVPPETYAVVDKYGNLIITV